MPPTAHTSKLPLSVLHLFHLNFNTRKKHKTIITCRKRGALWREERHGKLLSWSTWGTRTDKRSTVESGERGGSGTGASAGAGAGAEAFEHTVTMVLDSKKHKSWMFKSYNIVNDIPHQKHNPKTSHSNLIPIMNSTPILESKFMSSLYTKLCRRCNYCITLPSYVKIEAS